MGGGQERTFQENRREVERVRVREGGMEEEMFTVASVCVEGVRERECGMREGMRRDEASTEGTREKKKPQE